MARQGRVVAIIPARGGSKGLPRKNILPLMGKPVLAHTAEAALRARSLDRVILSTDSEEIAQVGREWGLEVPFMRPDHLSTDTAHPTEVLEHALCFLEEQEGYQTEVVVTLQPTSPLRRPEHIDQAVGHLFDHSDLDSVISVEEAVLPPYWVLRCHGHVLRPFVDDGVDYSLTRRQDFEQLYKPNGAVYVTRRDMLRDNHVIYSAFKGGNTGYIVMDQESSLQIDTQTDLTVIESVLQAQKQEWQ